jgi:uncharacterized membrane protein
MLLLCVVFALITVGFVVPCVIDIAITPQHDFGLPSKQTWLAVVVVFWAFGATAWLLVGRRDLRTRQLWRDQAGNWPLDQQQAFRRHPAGRAADSGYELADAVLGGRGAPTPSRYVAPDDNPDFLHELDRRIREWRDDA